jgi:hypothetical protein
LLHGKCDRALTFENLGEVAAGENVFSIECVLYRLTFENLGEVAAGENVFSIECVLYRLTFENLGQVAAGAEWSASQRLSVMPLK